MQVSRGEALGSGLWSACARDVQDALWRAIHLQQGVGIVRQLITGKEWYRPATDRWHTLEQHVSVRLSAFAHHKGGHQAPCWCKGDPHPGIAIQCQDLLGHTQ